MIARIPLVLAALLLAFSAHAWEFENNPDRVPSLAFSRDAGSLEDDAVSMRRSVTTASLRLPLADVISVDIRAGRETQRAGEKSWSGRMYGGTLRMYFVPAVSAAQKREAADRVQAALDAAARSPEGLR